MPGLCPPPRRPRARRARRRRQDRVKILLDACVSGGASGTLRAAGHDVVWAGDWDESASDEDIIARAAAEGRILVTLDKDFGELAVVQRVPHAGIIRLVAGRT